MNEPIRELKREIEALKKEIAEIKTNYLSIEKLTKQLDTSLKNTKDCY